MLKPTQTIREKPYLNEYNYKAVFKMAGAWTMRGKKGLNPDIAHCKKTYSRTRNNRYGLWRLKEPETLGAKTFQMIKHVLPIILENNEKLEFRTSSTNRGSFTVYTSDLNVINELSTVVDLLSLHEAIGTATYKVKYFAGEPPANFRIFLKYGNINYSEINHLLEMNDGFKLSPSMNKSLEITMKYASHQNLYIRDNFFVDCNSEQDVFYFSLMFPNLVRETYKLEKKPANV